MLAHVDKAIAQGSRECIIFHGVGDEWITTPLPMFIELVDGMVARRDKLGVTGHSQVVTPSLASEGAGWVTGRCIEASGDSGLESGIARKALPRRLHGQGQCVGLSGTSCDAGPSSDRQVSVPPVAVKNYQELPKHSIRPTETEQGTGRACAVCRRLLGISPDAARSAFNGWPSSNVMSCDWPSCH